MASAGARFESARASGDRAAARAAVEDIVSDAKDPAKRAALASSGAAVSIAAELLRAARAACWCDAADATEAADAFLVPFAPLARALRNVCAGNAVARGGACALPRRDAPEALALALPALAARVDRSETGSRVSGSSGSETEKASKAAVSALAAATQLACNLIAGGGVAAETTWRVLFPKHFAVIAALKNEGAARATHPALCSAMSARFAATGLRSADSRLADSRLSRQTSGSRQTDAYDAYDAYDEREVCGFVAGATVWRPLLRASVRRGDAEDDSRTTRDVGVEDVGATLLRFVESFCLFGGEAAPPLCRALAPLAAETARARDEALRRKILGMALHADGAREGTNFEKKNDDEKEKAAVRERFSVEQATLLELVARAAAAAPARDPSRERSRLNARDVSDLSREAACVTNAAPPATLVLSEGTAAYVLDLASRAAEALERARRASAGESPAIGPGEETETETEPEGEDVCQADAARVTLRACLGVLRALSEREARPAVAQTPGDDVTSACAMGAPRLLLGLLAALPVPAGAGNSEKKKARGPSAAPDLSPKTFEPITQTRGDSNDGSDLGSENESLAASLRSTASAPYPSVRPWDGYRVDALAPLANAMFGRPAVCDMVQKLGGVPVILACTRGEDGDEYLREYALWAVRNVCAGSDAARREIEALQPRAAADAHELAAAGLNVNVDPETGRVKVSSSNPKPRGGAIPEGAIPVSGPGGGELVSVASARGVAREEKNGSGAAGAGRKKKSGGGLGTVMFSGGGEHAKTPVGRAVQAALEAGLEPALPGDEEDVEVPKHWKIADLS